MNRHLYRLAMGGLFALAVVIAVGCDDKDDAPPPLTAEECPHDWPWTTAQEKNIEAFTGERDEVPEYNDCQRFLLGSLSNPSYGNVFAIFVADSVAEAHGTGGDTPQETAGAAHGTETEVPSSAASAATSAANRNEMAAVALIAAWEDYGPLGISGPGFYCLLMDSRPRPSAAIVQAGANADCENPVMSTRHDLFVFPPRLNRPNLPGRPTNVPLTSADVPGVVRWGFDGIPAKSDTDTATAAARWVQYVIVPCGTAICYVGPTGPGGSGAGFTPKPPHAVLAGMGNLPLQGRAREVDFWHDTQFLADPGSSTGSPAPAKPALVGVLIPDDSLGNKTIKDFEGGWVPVAEVGMSDSAYANKFNFAATGSKYNTVEACAYTAASPNQCTGVPEVVEVRCKATDPQDPTNPADPPARKWRARHTNVDGTPTYHCIEYIPPSNSDLTVPGTARWKWLKGDEALWFRCENGCCKDIG